MMLIHSASDFCLIGARGSGKSVVVHEFAGKLGYSVENVVLYQVDMIKFDKIKRYVKGYE